MSSAALSPRPSPPIPSLSSRRAASFRSSLACLACRAGKSKCDGMIPGRMAKQEIAQQEAKIKTEVTIKADTPCSRCNRMQLECSWKPCQRFGRPPKRRSTSDTEASEGGAVDAIVTASGSRSCCTPTFEQTVFPDTNAATYVMPDTSEGDGEQWWDIVDQVSFASTLVDGSLSSEQYGDLTQLLDQSLFQSGELDMIQQVQQQQWTQSMLATQVPLPNRLTQRSPVGAIVSSPCAAPAAPAATPADQFTLLRNRIQGHADRDSTSPAEAVPASSTTADALASPSPTTYDASLRDGITRFFASVGRSLPVYANRTDFYERLSACEAQAYPVAALGHALFEGHASPSCMRMHQQATDAVRSPTFLDTLHNSYDTTRVAHHIATLIFVGYLAYSTEDMDTLRHDMRLACSAAVRIGLHRVDDGRQSTIYANRDALRRIWWELWVSDAIMDVVTSGAVSRTLGSVQATVKFPGDTRGTDGGMLAKVYSVRIRAVALLIDSVTALKKMPTAATVKRLAAADTVQANVIAETQQLSIAIARARSQRYSAHNLSNSVEQTMLFDCLTMLHAGRIHSHRLFWFADLTLNLQSCSFQRATIAEAPGVDEQSACDTAARRRQFSAEMSASVAQIVASSDAILAMMRIDTEQTFRAHALASSGLRMAQDNCSAVTKSSPIIAPHWPVVGCCQIVASYGLAVGIAAGEMGSGGSAHQTQTDNTAAYNQVGLPQAASFQSLLDSSKDGLRTVESISGIAFAEATLSLLSNVWPIASKYQEQVHACRIAIDSRL